MWVVTKKLGKKKNKKKTTETSNGHRLTSRPIVVFNLGNAINVALYMGDIPYMAVLNAHTKNKKKISRHFFVVVVFLTRVDQRVSLWVF